MPLYLSCSDTDGGLRLRLSESIKNYAAIDKRNTLNQFLLSITYQYIRETFQFSPPVLSPTNARAAAARI